MASPSDTIGFTHPTGGAPSPAALTRLQRYRFIAQVTHRGELSKPFALAGIRVEDALGAGRPQDLGELEAAIASSGRRCGVAGALAHLETLDERILAELRKRLRGGEAPGQKLPDKAQRDEDDKDEEPPFSLDWGPR